MIAWILAWTAFNESSGDKEGDAGARAGI